VHALESLSSNNASLPSNFKLKENLEKQVTVIGTYIWLQQGYLAVLLKFLLLLQITFTTPYLLGFISPNDDPSLKDFLIKVRVPSSLVY
jgi:HEAT repeat-containing protein 6